MINKAFICFMFICFSSFSLKCHENASTQINKRTTNADSSLIGNTYPVDISPDTVFTLNDSIPQVEKGTIVQSLDTIAWLDAETVNVPVSPETKVKFKPNSNRAILYTAIFPGLGQIYNRKYWKLPLVYGGLVGLVYAITWNGRIYGDYTDGYRAIMKNDYYSEANRDAWYDLLSRSQKKQDVNSQTYQIQNPARLDFYRQRIRRSRDFYRRNRDLAIISVIGLYAVSMIDAYVDAELFDFDITPDLTFRVAPSIGLDPFQHKMIGIQCNVMF